MRGLSRFHRGVCFIFNIDSKAGVMACVVTIVGVVVIAFVIWLGFMRYNRRLAGKMNEAIREMK